VKAGGPPADREPVMHNNNLIGASWITLILAVVLAVAPFVVAFPTGATTTISIAYGVIIAVFSLCAIALNRSWSGWFNFILLNMVLGAIVAISPIVLHFDDAATIAGWVYVLVGLGVWIIAFVQMWRYTTPVVRA
jgi:hypothetical protein